MPRALNQRASQTVPAGLEGDCNAFDPASRILRFLSPAIEQVQQYALVDRKLLQRLAFDARHDAGNEPARQTHFDHRDQCAVLFQDDTGLAQVAWLLHWGLHRFTSATMDAISSPPPHSISNENASVPLRFPWKIIRPVGNISAATFDPYGYGLAQPILCRHWQNNCVATGPSVAVSDLVAAVGCQRLHGAAPWDHDVAPTL